MKVIDKPVPKSGRPVPGKWLPDSLRPWKAALLPQAGDFIAIEFDRYLVKQIHIEKNGSRDRVRSLNVKFFSSESDDDIARILREHLAGMGETQNRHATISIPRRSTHTKILRLPSQDERELRQLVANYMYKEIPIPGQEIVSDFRVIGADDSGYSRVMLVMVRKNDIVRYLNICEQSGLIVDAVHLNVEATYHAFMNTFQHTPSLASRTIAIVDVDFSATNIMVVHHGGLAYSRTLNASICELMDRMVKTQNVNQYENWIDDLATGIDETLAIFAGAFSGFHVDEVVLSGWLPRVRTVLYRMQDRFDIPIDWFDPSISLRSFCEFGAENVHQQWFSVSSLVGMALAQPQELMEFRPAENRRSQRQLRGAKKVAVTVLLCGYLLALISGVLVFRLHSLKAATARLRQQISQMRPKIDAYERVLRIQQTVVQELGSEASTAAVLARVFEKLPPGIELTSLNFIRGDRIVVRGVAANMSDVLGYSELLATLEEFESAGISSVSRQTGNTGGDSFTFEMKIVLKTAKP